MITLVLTDSSGRERKLEIGPKPQVVGRGEDSDIILGSRSIARHHMKIWEENGRVMVEDLTDGSGISINGEQVSKTFELAPGVDLEIGVFVINLPGGEEESSVLASEAESKPIPTLIGTKGFTKGLEIELQDGDNDLGRDPALYMVMDDPSISRMHARISIEAEQCTLIDMRSSNGTFVNDSRIERVQINSGDLIRFGNLEFRFQYGQLEQEDASPIKKKRRLIIISGAAAGTLLIVIILLLLASAKPKQKSIVNKKAEVPVSILVEQHLRSVRSFMDEGEWDSALRELSQALSIHPICRECLQLEDQCKREVTISKQYDECVLDYDLNRWQKSLDCFRRIPTDSYYHKRSKYKISECNKHLELYHMAEGKGYFNAGLYLDAHKHFVAYMKLRECDKRTFDKWLTRTEKKLKASYVNRGKWQPYEWSCEHKAELVGVVDPEEILTAEYTNKKIFEAMLTYHEGKVDTAIYKLQRVVALDKDARIVEKAKDLVRYLRVVKGKYADGVSRLLQGDLKYARQAFDQALVADAKVMPQTLRSFYREDMGKQLANGLYRSGFGLYNLQHYGEAFIVWKECLQRDPASLDCKNGLKMLDEIAESTFDEAQNLLRRGERNKAIKRFGRILDMTSEESVMHRKTKARLKEIEP